MRLNTHLTSLAKAANVALMCDCNAEPVQAKKHKLTPADSHFQGLLDGLPVLQRLGALEPTYFLSRGTRASSIIDHVIIAPGVANMITKVERVDGPESHHGSYHMGLEGVIDAKRPAPVEGAEQRRPPGRLCDHKAARHKWAACIAHYHRLLGERYLSKLQKRMVWHNSDVPVDGNAFDWAAAERTYHQRELLPLQQSAMEELLRA
jgi:hypothetical protein